MRKTVRLATLTLIGLLASGLLIGCQQADVVAVSGIKAFEALSAVPALKTALSDDKYFRLNTPNKEFVALSTTPEATTADLVVSVQLKPFLDAGLDVSKLPEGYQALGDTLILSSNFTDTAFKKAPTTATLTMEGLVAAQRERFGYHQALDHYGIGLGNGNMFEWAKDMATNDKDFVYVLEPSLLEAAGVDPSAVEGWLYADVEVMDDKNQKKMVKKLLKPIDLP